MNIRYVNVNRHKKKIIDNATALNDGLLISTDKIALDALVAANVQGNNISEITITGPTLTEIKPLLDNLSSDITETNDKLSDVSEKLASISVDIDLTDYVKIDDIVSNTKSGLMTAADYTKLCGIEANATKDEPLTNDEIDEVTVID